MILIANSIEDDLYSTFRKTTSQLSRRNDGVRWIVEPLPRDPAVHVVGDELLHGAPNQRVGRFRGHFSNLA